MTRPKHWWSVLFLQEYDKKRETKNRERQLYHLRHSNDYDMLELPMGASKVSPPAARCSNSLGQSNPELAPPHQHGSKLMAVSRQAACSWLHAHRRVAPDRAWAMSAASSMELGFSWTCLTTLCICIGEPGLPNYSTAYPAVCVLAGGYVALL